MRLREFGLGGQVQMVARVASVAFLGIEVVAVSYTHLTLPTIYSV